MAKAARSLASFSFSSVDCLREAEQKFSLRFWPGGRERERVEYVCDEKGKRIGSVWMLSPLERRADKQRVAFRKRRPMNKNTNPFFCACNISPDQTRVGLNLL